MTSTGGGCRNSSAIHDGVVTKRVEGLGEEGKPPGGSETLLDASAISHVHGRCFKRLGNCAVAVFKGCYLGAGNVFSVLVILDCGRH